MSNRETSSGAEGTALADSSSQLKTVSGIAERNCICGMCIIYTPRPHLILTHLTVTVSISICHETCSVYA